MSDTDRKAPKKREDPSPGQWLRRRWRILLYLLSLVCIVALQTALYWWGMRAFEGDPRTLLDSLDVIVQSLTTTGYGQDAPWSSPFVSALVIVAQFTGVAYLFVAFPLFIVPWLQDLVVEPTVPEVIESVEDHVVLSGEEPLYATLVDDLTARGQPHVIVESDDDLARSLYEDDYTVVVGDAAETETLRNAGVADARAIVVDTTTDEIGAVLSATGLAPDVGTVALVDDPAESRHLRRAGATSVLSPKHRLGKSLADKAHGVVPAGPDGPVDDAMTIAEFSVAPESDIFGRRLDDLDELVEHGATLLGAWVRGEFVTSFSTGDRVDESTVLTAAGTESQLDDLSEITHTTACSPRSGPVVVVGYGIVGLTAEGILRKADRDVTVVGTDADTDAISDADAGPLTAADSSVPAGARSDADAAPVTDPAAGPDVVGDPTSVVTLREAGVADAATVIVALADDETAVRTVLGVRDANPDAELVVAANEVGNAGKFSRAGATAVFPLPRIAARMTTLELFDEGAMTLSDRIQFAAVDGASLVELPADADAVRGQTGAAVVAVRHRDDVVTDLDDVALDEADELIVAGTADRLDAFRATYCR